ncbi:F-box/FBD/LRR-repeat protein At2g26030-like [Impatiens glandulifera]|uniref:F-box/FBD/LRR-repeat protein At2g26030-like n=1 Tax=Impatiens glandulifera TaxID=253017 RepID=UPI001FB064B2|nr:F-box/FBD/LRR-repeat protein At2g26030-like [Impatiens glandulifera]
MNLNGIVKRSRTNENQNSTSHVALDQEVDYISQVPAGILFYILSFLPFEYWIILGMVSRKWTYLLREAPILILDEDYILIKMARIQLRHMLHGEVSIIGRNKKNKRRYIKFVDHTLLLHSGCLIKLMYLNFEYEPNNQNDSMINNWVHFMMTRDIHDLVLNFSTNPKLNFELKFLAVKRTKSESTYELLDMPYEPKFRGLTLNSCKFKASSFVAFSNLKSLHLSHVEVFDSSIGELLSKCPCLEDLHMDNCIVPESFFKCENDLKLKNLCLVNCLTENWYMFEIDISVPELLSFLIRGKYLMTSTIRKATKLVDSMVYIEQEFSDFQQGNLLAKFLIGMKHCKILTLSSWCIQVLSTIDYVLSYQLRGLLTNLKELNLSIGCSKQELPGMVTILQSCPYLESLIMEFDWIEDIYWMVDDRKVEHLPEVFHFEEEKYFETPKPYIRFLKNCLKDIQLKKYMGEENEIRIVKYLLQNALVLEDLVVYVNSSADIYSEWQNYFIEFDEEMNWQELRDLPKASTNVKLYVLEN